jgi:hypothetical protein
MKRPIQMFSAALALTLLLAACGSSEGEGGGLNETRPTRTPQATVISPEELAKQSAESSGYAMKVLAVQDPATPLAEYTLDGESRLVAVQVELTVTDSEEKMATDGTYATVTDDSQIDYTSVASAIKDELAVGEIGKGEKASGWIAFSVPKAAKLKTITYRIGLISVVALTVDLPQK